MNLRELMYFVAVAETKHVGLAAQKCFVSQPTLSVQLQKLEAELGVQLFERQNKALLLSSAGHKLLPQAQAILQAVDNFKSSAKVEANPLGGIFKLGVIPTIGPYMLPQIITKSAQQLPDLQLQITELQTDNLVGLLQTGKIDAALLATDESNKLLAATKLCSEDFYYVSSKRQTAAAKITPEQIQPGSLLLLDEGHCLRDQGLAICNKDSSAANDQFRATSMQTLLAMVAAGYGATLIPKSVKDYYQDMDSLNFVPLTQPVPQRHIYLTWRRATNRSLCIKKLVSILATK